MSIHLSDFQGAKEIISRLDTELKALAADLRRHGGDIRVDAIWSIPLRNTNTVDADAVITPIELTGIDAASFAITVLTNIWLSIGQSNRETQRGPGVIGMPSHLLDQVRATNDLRAELIAIMAPLTQAERTKIWEREKFISALQTQRITPILNDPLAVRFYWDKSVSIKRSAAGDLLKTYKAILEGAHGSSDVSLVSLHETDAYRKYAFARDVLIDLEASEPIAIYRPGQPHVRARVHDGDGVFITATSTPFVYDIATSKAPVIKMLEAYDPKAKVITTRSPLAKVEAEPFCEKLFLHRYLKEHRTPITDTEEQAKAKKPIRHQRKIKPKPNE